MSTRNRWSLVVAAVLGSFALVWLVLAIFGMDAGTATQVAGVVASVVGLPLGTWAAQPPATTQDHHPQPEQPPDPVEPEVVEVFDELDADEFRWDYLNRVLVHFHSIDLDVLTPTSEMEESSVVPLDSVFVGQLVKEGPRPLDLPRELIQRANGGSDPRELPDGLTRAAVTRVMRAHEHQPSIPVLALLAREDATRTVLLGDPGSGKSTLLKYVAYTIAKGEIDDEHPLAPLAGWLPIYIELRDYIRHDGTFLDYLDYLHLRERLGLPKQILEEQLRDAQVVLMFDGLDEIFDQVVREEAMKQIEGLAARYPRARFVVTSRIADYRRKVLEIAGFRRYYIQDLDRPQIEAFIQRWYRDAHPASEQEATSLTANLIAIIDQTPSVAELAGNPMLLTILAIIARRRPLPPRDRASVYEHAVNVLIEQWDVRKLLPAADTGAGQLYLDTKDKLEMLRLIARHMQDSPAGLSGNFITAAELKSQFAAFLSVRDPGRLSPAQARHAADQMLNQFHRRNFILSQFGDDTFGFVHRSFLEYLAAADIVHRFNRDRTLTEDELINGLFGGKWRDPSWHEVLLLTAGMLGEQFVNRAVLKLLSADPRWAASNLVEPHHILLAIRCIGEVRRIAPMTEACRQAVEAIIQLLGVAHRRAARRHSDALARSIEKSVVPVFAAIATWPGRQRYLDWFAGNGLVETDDDTTSDIAARLAATMLADSEQLFEFLRSQATRGWNTNARAAAMTALAAGWRDRAEAMTLVRERAVTDPEPAVRESALRAVAAGRHHEAQDLALLLDRAVNDAEPQVRRVAVQAVAASWHTKPATLDLLVSIAHNDQHEGPRVAAVQAIVDGWPQHRATVPLLRDRATADPDDYMRRVALLALAKVARSDPETVDLLRERVTADMDADVRQTALSTIATTWANSPETPALLRRIAAGSPDSGLRQTAVRAIGRDPRINDTMAELLLSLATGDPDAGVRQAAIETLATNRRNDPALPQRLREQARADSHPGVRNAGLRVIARTWRDAETLSWLRVQARNDRSPAVRAAAVEMIAIGWHDSPETEAWLHEMGAEDTSPVVRTAALQVLSTEWNDDEDTLPWLRIRAEKDPNADLRHLALNAIADDWSGNPGTLPLLRRRADDDTSPAVRQFALEAIATGWHDDPQTLPLLMAHAQRDPHHTVRSLCLTAAGAGWRDDPQTLPLLRALAVHDRHQEPRRDAILAVADGWHDDPQTVPLLRDRAVNDPHHVPRLAAIEALAVGWHDDDALAVLHDRVAADQHWAIRLLTLQAIVQGWIDHPRTLAVVQARLTGDDTPTVRGAAAQALRDSWYADPATLPCLERALGDEANDHVRAVLETAIAEVRSRTEGS